MNELIKFQFRGHDIREITDEKGNPWFVAKDVCEVLEMAHNREAVSRLHNGDVRQIDAIDALGRLQKTNIINEAGLYFIILRSDKPIARKFQYWVTHEVIPQIRKTGSYSIQELSRLDILEMAIESEKEKLKLEQQIQEDVPKIEAYNHFICADGFKTINQVAKELGTGEKRLFQFLRDIDYLYYEGKTNLPNQRYTVEQDKPGNRFFVVKSKIFVVGDKEIPYSQTFVTPKGEERIAKLWREKHMGVLGQGIINSKPTLAVWPGIIQ